jgi:pimeloyl-ACP methyl ester carboxylesterase
MMDCAPKTFDAAVAEDNYRKKGADDLSEWPAPGSLGNIPLLVLSHDPDIGALAPPNHPDAEAQAEKAWGDFNEQLTKLSSDGSRVVVKGSKHYIQFDRPEIVIDGVREVVKRAKRDRPLLSPNRAK